MKAWRVRDTQAYTDFATVVFAETRGKAHAIAMHTDACRDAAWNDVRVMRAPELDRFYRGVSEMDWYNEDDMVALVRYGGYRCSYEIDSTYLECDKCAAREWCERYHDEQEVGDG